MTSRLHARWRRAVLVFIAGLGACGVTDPDLPRRTLDVAAYKAVCAGAFYRFCLKVREVGETEWELLYDSPGNLDFEWGVAQRIVVEEEELENPRPDGGSVRRTVIREVSRETLPADSRFILAAPAGTTAEAGSGVHQFDFGSESFRCVDGPDCEGMAQALQGNHAVELSLELGPRPDDPFRVVSWRACPEPWPICG